MFTTAGDTRLIIGESDGTGVLADRCGERGTAGNAARPATGGSQGPGRGVDEARDMRAIPARLGRPIDAKRAGRPIRQPAHVRRISAKARARVRPRSGRLHLDALRLHLRLLRNAHLEHAVGLLRGDAFGLRGLGQREAAEERAGHALDALIALAVRSALGLALALDVSTPFSAVISMSLLSTPGRSTCTTKRFSSSRTSTEGSQSVAEANRQRQWRCHRRSG